MWSNKYFWYVDIIYLNSWMRIRSHTNAVQCEERRRPGSGTDWDLWSSVYPLNCIFHPHCFILLVQVDWFLVFPNSRLPMLGKLLGLDPSILPHTCFSLSLSVDHLSSLTILSPWAWTTCLRYSAKVLSQPD